MTAEGVEWRLGCGSFLVAAKRIERLGEGGANISAKSAGV